MHYTIAYFIAVLTVHVDMALHVSKIYYSIIYAM